MDIEHIKSLVELMVAHDLSRIELREGDTHILLRRGHAPVVSAASANPTFVHAMPPPLAGAPASAAAEHAPGAPGTAPAHEQYIRSPMVGTVYAAPDPESPPFAKVGDLVGPDTVVCLVEAMKVFNEIKAEVAGTITRVLFKNAQAVEFDQPLFAVAPA